MINVQEMSDKHGHHFASFFPKQPDALETFNRGAMVGLLVVAVAIAMVMVISLLLVRRKPYGTISHGIVEVGPDKYTIESWSSFFRRI